VKTVIHFVYENEELLQQLTNYQLFKKDFELSNLQAHNYEFTIIPTSLIPSTPYCLTFTPDIQEN
jgi:hypothetical protein